jgi:hypothetical protein
MLIHSVYFWLKPELTDAERANFRAEVQKLSAVRTIEKIYVGPPASLRERDVTERSFDVALTIVFRDGPAHDAYQVDPIHLAFVERNQRSWTRVQVYDSLEGRPARRSRSARSTFDRDAGWMPGSVAARRSCGTCLLRPTPSARRPVVPR